MPVLAGPFAVASVLLLVGGAAKARHPDDTARAIRALGLPSPAVLVRLFALGEMVIGAAALLVGGRVAALLVAASYIGFSAFVALAMLRGGVLSSCGCFGSTDTPPTIVHLLVTLGLAAVSLVTAADPVGPLLDGLRGQPLAGLPFVLLTGCSVWLAYAALALLPRASWSAATRRAS
jgi:uncharacterized membrane protein YphA (DoxX/SURF4 family)